MRRRALVVAVLGIFLAVARTAPAPAEDEAKPIFPKGSKEPQVAVSPSHGAFVVAARDGVISVASSADGRTFGAPVEVARVDKLMCGMRRGPRIAASDRSVVVTAISSEGGDLQAWRSTDQGASWQGPVRVNGTARSAREGLSGLAADAKDDFAAVWLDDRKGGKEVWAATSTDGGATWTEALAYSSPAGHVCECCHPSAAFNAKGELAIMWRNWLDGARDLYLATSKDLAKTWSKPQRLGDGSWKTGMCPMDGGAVAGRAEGGFGTVWRRDREVFATMPGKNGEALLGPGKQCWLALGPGGAYAVWLDGEDLLAATPQAKRATRIAGGASDPCVAGPLDGKGPVLLVWQSDDGVRAKVLAARK